MGKENKRSFLKKYWKIGMIVLIISIFALFIYLYYWFSPNEMYCENLIIDLDKKEGSIDCKTYNRYDKRRAEAMLKKMKEFVFELAESQGIDCSNKTWNECAYNNGEGLSINKEV